MFLRLGPTDVKFAALVQKLTENFDNFDDKPLPSGVSKYTPAYRKEALFLGYTFKKVDGKDIVDKVISRDKRVSSAAAGAIDKVKF